MSLCDMCLSEWLKHPNDSSSYCAQCEWKVEEIAEFNLRKGRREALEEAAKAAEAYLHTLTREEEQAVTPAAYSNGTVRRIADTLRALAKEPKS